MGMILPLMIFVAFLGLNATMSARNKIFTPPQQSMAALSGQNFIKYRDAVSNFAAANPNFTGIAPWSGGIAPYLYGGNANATAFANMSNAISSISGGGRQVVSYQTSGGGAATVLAQSGYDASIGRTDSAGNWQSYSSSSNRPTQTTGIKNCNLVSVLDVN